MLSVTLLAVNEEKELARCLDSVKDIADEIIVGIDDKTSDGSEKVARKYTKNVFVLKHNDNFHILKKAIIHKSSQEWVFQLDADEVVTPELLNEIKKVINSNPEENGFWIPRSNFFLGRFLRKGGVYPDYTLRLYRNGKGNLPGKSVHEQAVVEGKIGYLTHNLLHFNNPTFSVYLNRRLNRYTNIMAKEIKGGFIVNVIINPLFDENQGFLSIYLRHLGFLDGFPGFVWALFSALHFPIAYFKYLDLKRESKIN